MGQIELVFERDGKTVHKKTTGFVGAECVKKTKFIDDAIGTPGDRKFTSEFYEEHEQEHEDGEQLHV